MSLATSLRSVLNTRRPAAGVSRAMLDLDAGDLLTPTVYPYGAAYRTVSPFASRVIDPGRGPRKLGQLYPPDGNPTQRTFGHIDYTGRRAAIRAGTRDVAGVRRDATGARIRPWLFAGGSSATTAAKLAAGPAAAAAGGCSDCD